MSVPHLKTTDELKKFLKNKGVELPGFMEANDSFTQFQKGKISKENFEKNLEKTLKKYGKKQAERKDEEREEKRGKNSQNFQKNSRNFSQKSSLTPAQERIYQNEIKKALGADVSRKKMEYIIEKFNNAQEKKQETEYTPQKTPEELAKDLKNYLENDPQVNFQIAARQKYLNKAKKKEQEQQQLSNIPSKKQKKNGTLLGSPGKPIAWLTAGTLGGSFFL